MHQDVKMIAFRFFKIIFMSDFFTKLENSSFWFLFSKLLKIVFKKVKLSHTY